jgi:hypothetical protein
MIAVITPEVQAIRYAAIEMMSQKDRDFEAETIGRGADLALYGAIEVAPDGTIRVRSASGAGSYVVEGTRCQCPNNRRAIGGRCKHVTCLLLLERAKQMLASAWEATFETDEIELDGLAFPQGKYYVFLPEGRLGGIGCAVGSTLTLHRPYVPDVM